VVPPGVLLDTQEERKATRWQQAPQFRHHRLVELSDAGTRVPVLPIGLIEQLQAELQKVQTSAAQAKASAQKADFEVQLANAGEQLINMEQSRQQATGDKKALEQDNLVIKKDIEDLELAIQKLEQEKNQQGSYNQDT